MNFDYMTAEEESNYGTTEDMVNAPRHYASEDGLECWQAQVAAVGVDGYIAHCRATAIKYAWRAGTKDPTAEAQDLRKACWFLEKAAQLIER